LVQGEGFFFDCGLVGSADYGLRIDCESALHNECDYFIISPLTIESVVMSIAANWKKEFEEPKFMARFVVSLVALVVVLYSFTHFLGWVEVRAGVTLHDPILTMIAPRDFTWATFALIYAGVIAAIVHFAPQRLLVAMQAYTLMVVVRMLMMWLVPLNAPEGLIVLRDPIVQLLGDGSAPTKDLFFSGHTATMFLFFLAATSRMMKMLFLTFTFLVAAFVLWQHVHYTIDVFVAPFVTFGCFRVCSPNAESADGRRLDPPKARLAEGGSAGGRSI
jgi:hypothetical protein